jgi:hypothetical protein
MALRYATPKEDGSAAEGFQGHQAGWKGPAPRPLFIIGLPFNRKAATPGNGQMTKFGYYQINALSP